MSAWADSMVASIGLEGSRADCPIGTLAAAPAADINETFRAGSARPSTPGGQRFTDALARLRDNGRLEPKSDLDQLTMSTLAAVQGGLLLAKASRDSGQLGVVLDTAIAQLRTHAPASA